MADQKISPSDVLQQLANLRGQVDGLPDAVSQQRTTMQAACDQLASMIKAALPKPGTYVTAGGAAILSGAAAVIGALGGGLLGHKLGKASANKPAAAAPQLSAAREGGLSAEEEQVAIAAAAEAVRSTRARNGSARRTG